MLHVDGHANFHTKWTFFAAPSDMHRREQIQNFSRWFSAIVRRGLGTVLACFHAVRHVVDMCDMISTQLCLEGVF